MAAPAKIKYRPKSSSNSDLDEINPPPPESDVMHSDEYFDADEDYLEPDLEKVQNGKSY
jgi:hypothetical protein